MRGGDGGAVPIMSEWAKTDSAKRKDEDSSIFNRGDDAIFIGFCAKLNSPASHPISLALLIPLLSRVVVVPVGW